MTIAQGACCSRIGQENFTQAECISFGENDASVVHSQMMLEFVPELFDPMQLRPANVFQGMEDAGGQRVSFAFGGSAPPGRYCADARFVCHNFPNKIVSPLSVSVVGADQSPTVPSIELTVAVGHIGGFEATRIISATHGSGVVEQFVQTDGRLLIKVSFIVDGILNELSGEPSTPTVVRGSMHYDGALPWRLAAFGDSTRGSSD